MFSVYDLALLIYENYITLDDLEDILQLSERGIRNKIEERAKMDKIYNETFADHKLKNIDVQNELQKFDEIKQSISDLLDVY